MGSVKGGRDARHCGSGGQGLAPDLGDRGPAFWIVLVVVLVLVLVLGSTPDDSAGSTRSDRSLVPSGRDLSASVVKRRYGGTIDNEDDDELPCWLKEKGRLPRSGVGGRNRVVFVVVSFTVL